MKVYRIFLICLLLLIVVIIGCESTVGAKETSFMVTENIQRAQGFPHTFQLKDGIDAEIADIGIKNMRVFDSIMVLTTNRKEDFLTFYALPDNKELGSFLNIGKGPFEFLYQPVLEETSFVKKNNDWVAFLYDFQNGKILTLNVNQSLKKGEADISVFADSISPFQFNMVMIDSTTFLHKELANGNTQQIRSFIKDNKKTTLPVLDRLNKATIKQGEDFNLLSTIAKYSEKRQRVVEISVSLNYLNIYAFDGSFEKTIYLGEKLDDLLEVQRKRRWNRKYSFTDVRLFDDFFGVVFINEKEKTFDLNRRKYPVIYLFDWDGNPLAELKLNQFITSFDIDFYHEALYTFDYKTEELRKYDIKEMLKRI